MSIDVNLTGFFLIFVRISTFVAVAPFFSYKQVPNQVKAGLSLFLAIIIFQMSPEVSIEYQTVLGYAILVVKEAVTGLTLGFFTNISYYILAFAGQVIDMEIGFSMVNELDPTSNIQTTITGNFYSYVVILMMLITNLHHHLIVAMVDTFKVIPLGSSGMSMGIYEVLIAFMRDYFIIGFRIVLPFFAAILIANVILGILIKVVPQLNMFVVGIQLKILIGLFMLFILVGTLPTISNFIFDEMLDMMRLAIEVLK
ncbi:MAG TPA: flagellar type III secretion system protein FliR [Clostridiales bacterium]|nr:flagellar type III secretion system protein FliR [Clostridiales bacterium]